MLTILAKIFKILNSEQSPSQIAAAIALAAIVGFTPLLSLHNLVVLFVVLFFRVNLTMFIVAWPLFTILGLGMAPVAQELGLVVLQAPALTSMWESFYNTLIGRWSNFYYSGVLGGLIIGSIVAIVGYPLFKILILKYRKDWMEKVEKIHIVKLLKASTFWQMYNR